MKEMINIMGNSNETKSYQAEKFAEIAEVAMDNETSSRASDGSCDYI